MWNDLLPSPTQRFYRNRGLGPSEVVELHSGICYGVWVHGSDGDKVDLWTSFFVRWNHNHPAPGPSFKVSRAMCSHTWGYFLSPSVFKAEKSLQIVDSAALLSQMNGQHMLKIGHSRNSEAGEEIALSGLWNLQKHVCSHFISTRIWHDAPAQNMHESFWIIGCVE